jgi:hypothetical protein
VSLISRHFDLRQGFADTIERVPALIPPIMIEEACISLIASRLGSGSSSRRRAGLVVQFVQQVQL